MPPLGPTQSHCFSINKAQPASLAISVAAQHFTYAALLISCSCGNTDQGKDAEFNSSDNRNSEDHHHLTPMPGFSLAYSGYTGPGNSAGSMNRPATRLEFRGNPDDATCPDSIKQCQKINRSHNPDSVCATPKTRIKKWDSWKARFQAAQSEEYISIEAKNYTRTALPQMAKVEVLSKIDKQEWYKNTIHYQKYAGPRIQPRGPTLRENYSCDVARLESLRSEITSQSSDERIPDRSAGNTKFETGETSYIGIGFTEIHPSPNLPRVGSFCSDADEVELESGQISGDAASFGVFNSFMIFSIARKLHHGLSTMYALID